MSNAPLMNKRQHSTSSDQTSISYKRFVVSLAPTLLGRNNASGKGAGGIWLPTSSATPHPCPLYDVTTAAPSPRNALTAHPIVWRATFDPATTSKLVSWTYPHGKAPIATSNLLAASSTRHEAAAQCFDIQWERTILSKTDNTPAFLATQRLRYLHRRPPPLPTFSEHKPSTNAIIVTPPATTSVPASKLAMSLPPPRFR
jgi:hypothetical protein